MSAARDDDALSWGGDDDPTLDTGGSAPAPIVAATPRAAGAKGAAGARTSQTADLGGASKAGVPALPDGFTAVGKGSDAARQRGAEDVTEGSGERAPLSSVMLVTLGVVAGAYLLYTIGWVLGGLRLQATADFLVSPLGYRIGLWLAVAAPALWLVTVLTLTRTTRSWVRVVWLVAGLALLVPWPLVMGGAVGS